MEKKWLFLIIAIALHLCAFLLGSFLNNFSSSTIHYNARDFISLDLNTKKVNDIENNKKTSTNISSSQQESLKSVSQKSSIATNIEPVDLENNNQSSIGTTFGSEEFSESILRYEEPIYPRLALKRGIEGVVKIRIKISKEGEPIETTTIKSSGHDLLDKATLEAALKWRFHKKSSEYFVEKNIAYEIRD